MNRAVKYLFLILVSFGAFSCSERKETRPTVMVIFGATGDLTAKKLLPAIDALAEQGRPPDQFAVVGVARRTEEEFRKQIQFNQKLYYSQGSFDQDESYEKLDKLLKKIDRGFGAKSNRIYFLATQASYFSPIVEKLSKHNMIYQLNEKQWSRVVIEKPFGHDLASAVALQADISQYLDESQIYRIDHYLGKEGVRNLVALRQNMDARWNKEHIDHIDIRLSEDIGIGTRGKFWEETGYLRDIVQNHMMQLVSLVAMDLPTDTDKIRDEKIKALQAIQPLDLNAVLRGQYGPGTIKGAEVAGYKEEKGVPASSTAETFVSATLSIDNDRWQGVPFHIQGGKRLAEQITEIVVFFKTGEELHIRIQPKPAAFFKGSSNMTFEPFAFSEAYQKLIYDCLQGDSSSFVQIEEQLAAWRLLTPVLEHWKTQTEIPIYPAGEKPNALLEGGLDGERF